MVSRRSYPTGISSSAGSDGSVSSSTVQSSRSPISRSTGRLRSTRASASIVAANMGTDTMSTLSIGSERFTENLLLGSR